MKRYSSSFNVWFEDQQHGQIFKCGNVALSAADIARIYGWRGTRSVRAASKAIAARGIRSLTELARTDPDTLRTAHQELDDDDPRIGDFAIKFLELVLAGVGKLEGNELWQEREPSAYKPGTVRANGTRGSRKHRPTRTATNLSSTPLTPA